MIKSFTSAVAAGALGLTLFGGGVAHAAEDTRPVKGTEACTDLVNGSADVRFAVVNVQAATTDLNTALRRTPVNDTEVANARAALADAQSDLRRTVTNVTDSLCKDGPVVTTPKPTTVVPAPVVDDQDCPDFPGQAAAQAHLNADRTDPDRLDRDNDGVACEDFFGEPGTTTVIERPTVIDRERISSVAVVPTRDDGSVATVTGGQVTVVPEGSASTGQA